MFANFPASLRIPRVITSALLTLVILAAVTSADEPEKPNGDQMIADYFRIETAKLTNQPLARYDEQATWNHDRPELVRQLHEMLGLDPLPEKTDLKMTITGKVEGPGFTVENLHFQSRPGLYVTGNLYKPEKIEGKLPAVLYVCGHSRVFKDGVAYGAKANYQHHGAWFARHGFICLTIDTLQLGEIEGIHHGTYRYDRWWWMNRGYTPAGVEAWNSIRALDLLTSLPEVDAENLGVTGRSGGGAYSWWLAALDERVKAAVPVAGITDLHNHVVDGTVEGHCDCMFWVNTYRWDYDMLPALIAPRAVLISNTDTDNIFPLDGVNRVFFAARKMYRLQDAQDKLALNIGPGGHKDIQELQIAAFHWLRNHLQGESGPIDVVAEKFFEPEQLKVFDKIPGEEINTEIDEHFVPQAEPLDAEYTAQNWETVKQVWTSKLDTHVFRAWPKDRSLPRVMPKGDAKTHGPVEVTRYVYRPQEGIELPLVSVRSTVDGAPIKQQLVVLDHEGWQTLEAELAKLSENHEDSNWSENSVHMLYIAPRGHGPTRWSDNEKKRVQIRRRFMLLGQTWDGMQVWDIRQGVMAWRTLPDTEALPLSVSAEGSMAPLALYASLYLDGLSNLNLNFGDHDLTHRGGPYFLNVSRYLELTDAMVMAAERAPLVIRSTQEDVEKRLSAPRNLANLMGWPEDRILVKGE